MDSKLYSIQIYPPGIRFEDFTPHTEFEKWAAVEVSSVDSIPTEMDSIEISGLYAIFLHRGTTADYFQKTVPFIYAHWLPHSGYQLDSRPQFEVMDHRYLGHENPESEEEVWVPVK